MGRREAGLYQQASAESEAAAAFLEPELANQPSKGR